ncbi:MAG: pyridoxal-phosphate dependent enzyme [Saprospiraceae bacterium]|nr:pyridoxal-phosphate dependent enzyme [Saprospiraceae bacterium]
MRGVFTYQQLLSGAKGIPALSLGEGQTPLVRSRYLGPTLGMKNLFFKLESLNPTGSYKDRFASLAIAGLMHDGSNVCLATSSGNTGAALAAYAAAAKINCHVAVVDGAPREKLEQMLAYGAKLWMVKDFGLDDTQSRQVFIDLQKLAEYHKTQVQISAFSYSPFGMQGVQTIAYEIAEELPAVEHVLSPAGGGGLTLATAKGFEIWSEAKKSFNLPRIHCVQPAGNDTIAHPLRNGATEARSIASSTTTISGLQVPNVIDGHETLHACRRSGGSGITVLDEDVYKQQKILAQYEGIYCEPAAAVSVSGLANALETRAIDPDAYTVCLITGHGFKDRAATKKMIGSNEIRYIEEIDQLKII